MKNLFKAAHKMTREIKEEFNEVDYRAQFAICLSYLQNNKEEESVEIGYQEIGNRNGTLYFAVNNIEGLKVAYLTKEKNLYNGKTFTKRHDFTSGCQIGTNKKTGEVKRLYQIEMNTGDIEISLGGKKEVIKNSCDLSVWGL